MKWLASCLAGLLFASSTLASDALELSATGSLQVAFTPGDDATGLVVKTLGQARKQILVQAYSFTNRAIADALINARRRGMDVRVLADRQQSEKQENSQIKRLAEQGIAVWIDADHAAAHNKVMVIDAGSNSACVITGSFNFTEAAQFRNAENLLVLSGNPNLAEAYAANWRRHRTHSLPLR